MMKRLAMLILAGLVVGCGTIARPAAPMASGFSVPLIPTPSSVLAAQVRKTIAVYPSANWCDKHISRQPIEDYNRSLAQALANLLAAPETASLSDSELASIYMDGAHPHTPIFPLVSGNGWVLATLPTYYESCAMGSHYIPIITRWVMFDRAGRWQTIKTIMTTSESGTFLFGKGAIQWVGDRWVVMFNDLNTLGFIGLEVAHIVREGDTWVIKSVLTAEPKDQTYFIATMQLRDGYQSLTLSSIRNGYSPPCSFQADMMDRFSVVLYTIANDYRWDGSAYRSAGERVADTRVILYAGKQRETYETLKDWQSHCIS